MSSSYRLANGADRVVGKGRKKKGNGNICYDIRQQNVPGGSVGVVFEIGLLTSMCRADQRLDIGKEEFWTEINQT